MKIVDCFLFYNEIKILIYRLETLWEIVDFFIIVESKYTFTGKKKELYTAKNKQLLEKYSSKIIHIVLQEAPFKYPIINYSCNHQWINEYYQRDGINQCIQSISYALSEGDIILIADVDEIPDRDILKKVKLGELIILDGIQCLEQDMYYYHLNYKLDRKWYSAKILTYEKYKDIMRKYNTKQYIIERIRISTCSKMERGGWHLSYFGDEHFVKNKIENFSHQEMNTSENTDTESIRKRIDECHKISIQYNAYLPPEYETYLQDFFELIQTNT